VARALTIVHVTFGYGTTPVLRTFSLEGFRARQFFAFLGPLGLRADHAAALIAGFGSPHTAAASESAGARR
jgi:hypothetical protein